MCALSACIACAHALHARMREGAQVWRGCITIAYREEELRAAVGRLQRLALGELGGTQCAVAPAADGQRSRPRGGECVCARADDTFPRVGVSS